MQSCKDKRRTFAGALVWARETLLSSPRSNTALVERAKLLECASPLALWIWRDCLPAGQRGQTEKRQRTGAVQKVQKVRHLPVNRLIGAKIAPFAAIRQTKDALFRRSAMARHSSVSGTASTIINSAPASSARCNSA